MTYAADFGRRAYTVRDLAVTLVCLLVAGSLLVSLTGATRDLSQAQVCADNLRQLFTGLTAYVNQYNGYPPHNPYPQYMQNETVNGVNTYGYDPNMGWLLTCGLGLEPPARWPDGHFKWYGIPYDHVPEVCKCPSMSPTLLDPTNLELYQPTPLGTLLYNYTLAYQTSGTCRAACPIQQARTSNTTGTGGRNPPIPDPTSPSAAKPYANSISGEPQGYFTRLSNYSETVCYIQAVDPSEVQCPGRVYYLADGRDYRPFNREVYGNGGYPPAGTYNGWYGGNGNKVFVGSRHYGYGNVMYLDGRVTRDGQMHDPMWSMDYDPMTNQAHSNRWRVSAFSLNIRLADIGGQWAIMPVLMVRGWEAPTSTPAA
jgi:prepilin-type processing-associated H-X9-DG protein